IGRATRDSGSGPGAAGVQRAGDERFAEWRERIFPGADGGDVRVDSGDTGVNAGGGGRVWRGFVRSGAADAGDWRAHGAGSAEWQRAGHDFAARGDPGGIWAGDRAGAFVGVVAVSEELAVSGEYGGPGDLRWSVFVD